MSLTVLKKYDFKATDVLDLSHHVRLLRYEREQWVSAGVEGLLLAYQRRCYPYYAMFILNTQNVQNFEETLTKELMVDMQPPFLIFTTVERRVFSLAFTSSEECLRLGELVMVIIEMYEGIAPKKCTALTGMTDSGESSVQAIDTTRCLEAGDASAAGRMSLPPLKMSTGLCMYPRRFVPQVHPGDSPACEEKSNDVLHRQGQDRPAASWPNNKPTWSPNTCSYRPQAQGYVPFLQPYQKSTAASPAISNIYSLPPFYVPANCGDCNPSCFPPPASCLPPQLPSQMYWFQQQPQHLQQQQQGQQQQCPQNSNAQPPRALLEQQIRQSLLQSGLGTAANMRPAGTSAIQGRIEIAALKLQGAIDVSDLESNLVPMERGGVEAPVYQASTDSPPTTSDRKLLEPSNFLHTTSTDLSNSPERSQRQQQKRCQASSVTEYDPARRRCRGKAVINTSNRKDYSSAEETSSEGSFSTQQSSVVDDEDDNEVFRRIFAAKLPMRSHTFAADVVETSTPLAQRRKRVDSIGGSSGWSKHRSVPAVGGSKSNRGKKKSSCQESASGSSRRGKARIPENGIARNTDDKIGDMVKVCTEYLMKHDEKFQDMMYTKLDNVLKKMFGI